MDDSHILNLNILRADNNVPVRRTRCILKDDKELN